MSAGGPCGPGGGTRCGRCQREEWRGNGRRFPSLRGPARLLEALAREKAEFEAYEAAQREAPKGRGSDAEQ